MILQSTTLQRHVQHELTFGNKYLRTIYLPQNGGNLLRSEANNGKESSR